MPVDIQRAEAAVRELLLAFGEDPDRPGLRSTPTRVAHAWQEFLSGADGDPVEELRTRDDAPGFPDVTASYDQVIVVAGIPFVSTCEHHLLVFRGTADVGYLPAVGGLVVGASKLPRLVRFVARRLQLQEQLTAQVADALMKATGARGVAVRCVAEHSCMSCRGVGVVAPMATQVLRGSFLESHAARAEFDTLVAAARGDGK